MWFWKGLPWAYNYFSCAWCYSETWAWVWNRLPRHAGEFPPEEMLRTGHSAGQPALADPAWGRLDDLQRFLPTSTVLWLILWNRLNQKMGKNQRKRIIKDQTENYLLLKTQKQNHHIRMYKTEIHLLYASLRKPLLEGHFQFWAPDFRI